MIDCRVHGAARCSGVARSEAVLDVPGSRNRQLVRSAVLRRWSRHGRRRAFAPAIRSTSCYSGLLFLGLSVGQGVRGSAGPGSAARGVCSGNAVGERRTALMGRSVGVRQDTRSGDRGRDLGPAASPPVSGPEPAERCSDGPSMAGGKSTTGAAEVSEELAARRAERGGRR